MQHPDDVFELPLRPPLRRRALGLALAAYLALFAAGLLALVGLATPVGPGAIMVGALAGVLGTAAVACWAADGLTRRSGYRAAPIVVEIAIQQAPAIGRHPYAG